MEIIRQAGNYTLLLDESTDNANRFELSLIARIVDEDAFMSLIQLPRCDANTIFSAVYGYLKKHKLDINRVCFSGMDGCSTMMGDHNGVQAHFRKNCSHHSSIHCRNHRLALCFPHLLPWYKEFENFDGLLLNVYLLLKNSVLNLPSSKRYRNRITSLV